MKAPTNKNDRSLYSVTTFTPRDSQSPSGGGNTKRTPEDLEDELNRMRDCSRAALRASWADAERLRTDATETEERVQELRVLIEELKEEKELMHQSESLQTHLLEDGKSRALLADAGGTGDMPSGGTAPAADVRRAAVANGGSAVGGDLVASMGGSSASTIDPKDYASWALSVSATTSGGVGDGGGGRGTFARPKVGGENHSGGDEIETTTEDSDACAKRTTWFGWGDNGPGFDKSGHIDGRCSNGDAADDDDDDDDDDDSADDDDDSICTEDLAMIEKRFGGGTCTAAGTTSTPENLEGKSTATATNNNERRVSWQNNLGASLFHRRPSTVDRSVSSIGGSLGRLDEDSVMDVSAVGEDSNPSLHGGKAEERLMAELSSVQAKMTDETTKLKDDIVSRNENIAILRSSTKEQHDEITIFKKEYNAIQSSMDGEGKVLRCEIEALRSQVKRLLIQDAALDKELKKVTTTTKAAARKVIQEKEQADDVKRLRAQIVAASENLKVAKDCRAQSTGKSTGAGMQLDDDHGEEDEDAVHIDVDSVVDDMSDMSAITAETFDEAHVP